MLKRTYTLFVPLTYKGEGITAFRRARELIMRSNWGRIKFPIHWCRLHVWLPHQFRTLTVERSPLNALVTKLAFLVSIGWQPIVNPTPLRHTDVIYVQPLKCIVSSNIYLLTTLLARQPWICQVDYLCRYWLPCRYGM